MGPPMSWAFFFPLDHRGYVIGPNFVRFFLFLYRFLTFSFCYSLLILLSFFNFFSFIYSYSCLLIGSYSSYSSRTILRFLIFFLIRNLFVVLHTYTQIMYQCEHTSLLLFFELLFLLFSSYSSLYRKPREIFQFGKKTAKVYHCLYSFIEQLQVAL
jgi:hypothetical protein